MLNKNEIAKIIAKYALILIVLYLIQYIFYFSFPYYLEKQAIDITNNKWLSSKIYFGVGILFNLITAIIVDSDIRRLQFKTRYITVMTLVWRPLGICLFLISLINNSRDDIV